MSGIVLNDSDVICAMDKNESGLFIPAKMKNGSAVGSTIGLKQLEMLKEKADSILAEMADSLHSGRIEAVPAFGKNYQKTCEYCDYKAICSYEDNIPVRELVDTDLKSVIEALEKGGEADEMDKRSAESN